MGNSTNGLSKAIEQLMQQPSTRQGRGRAGSSSPAIAAILRDLVLVEAARQGDEKAAELVLDQIRPLVGHVVARLDRQHVGAEPEDYINELWVTRDSAPRRLDLFHGLAPLGPWVESVVTRLVLDKRRSQKKFPAVGLTEVEQQPAADADPAATVKFRECIDRIVEGFVAIFAAIDDRDRLLAWLMYRFDGMQQDAIGALFDPPVSKSTICRYCQVVDQKVRRAFKVDAALRSSVDEVFEAPEALRRALAERIVEALRARSLPHGATVGPAGAARAAETPRAGRYS